MTLALLSLSAGLFAWWWVIRRHRAQVSPAWLVDNERREWGSGIDQSAVRSWPIQKDGV